ncbi:MAG: hypothetical protein IT244_02180 [Bacteroidia bacterium]|nr:hypothetical protein [Bacteroidia bacterium]
MLEKPIIFINYRTEINEDRRHLALLKKSIEQVFPDKFEIFYDRDISGGEDGDGIISKKLKNSLIFISIINEGWYDSIRNRNNPNFQFDAIKEIDMVLDFFKNEKLILPILFNTLPYPAFIKDKDARYKSRMPECVARLFEQQALTFNIDTFDADLKKSIEIGIARIKKEVGTGSTALNIDRDLHACDRRDEVDKITTFFDANLGIETFLHIFIVADHYQRPQCLAFRCIQEYFKSIEKAIFFHPFNDRNIITLPLFKSLPIEELDYKQLISTLRPHIPNHEFEAYFFTIDQEEWKINKNRLKKMILKCTDPAFHDSDRKTIFFYWVGRKEDKGLLSKVLSGLMPNYRKCLMTLELKRMGIHQQKKCLVISDLKKINEDHVLNWFARRNMWHPDWTGKVKNDWFVGKKEMDMIDIERILLPIIQNNAT